MRNVLLFGFPLVMLSGCGGGGPPTAPIQGPSLPVLQFPPDGAMIVQNDARSGCAFNPFVGYGLFVPFDWQDSTAHAGISHYEVFVQRRGSQRPAVDTRATDSHYNDVSCGSYVAEPFLEGWEWRVRAVDRDGRKSEWSPTSRFSYAQCLVDGGPCSAVP
jgi:hypothetical protein